VYQKSEPYIHDRMQGKNAENRDSGCTVQITLITSSKCK